MALAGIPPAGGAWIGLAGVAARWRGVNETVASLLLAYIAIALFNQLVEGPLRDPASLNKPSTLSIGDARHDRPDARHRRALGLAGRHRGLPRCAGC